MFEELFSSGALNLTYMCVLGLSFIFALISVAGLGLGDVFDFDTDVDVDIDADGIGFASISPMALAIFGAFFGLTGLVTNMWMGMSAIPSVLLALVVGLIFGGLTQVLYVYVLSVSKSSHYSLANDEAGRSAEVIISIPNEGVGTIAFDNVSGRVTLGARSTTGKQIIKGSVVRVEKIVGRVAYVRPLALGESEDRLLAEALPPEKQPVEKRPDEKWLE